MISILTNEDHQQYQLLRSTSKAADGGEVRYAAAMYFYNRGMMNDKALEIFRGLVKEPTADPLKALAAVQCQDQIELKVRET